MPPTTPTMLRAAAGDPELAARLERAMRRLESAAWDLAHAADTAEEAADEAKALLRGDHPDDEPGDFELDARALAAAVRELHDVAHSDRIVPRLCTLSPCSTVNHLL